MMPIRNYKPTSPGRRQMSVSTFEEITKKKPEKIADRAAEEARRPQQQGPDHDPPPWRWQQAVLPDHRLQAEQDRRSGQGRVDRVRSEPLGAHRAAALRGRREALHPGAGRPEGRRYRRRRSRCADPRRQRAAAAQHPDSVRRSTTSSCYPGKGGQLCRSAGTSAQLMAKQENYAQVRGCRPAKCAGAPRLHGDARPGRQCRSREHRDRQGRPQPPHGQAADGARLGHEPARPSARWW